MKIRNVREYPLELAATGQFVKSGETIEVDPELGASLLEQPDNWQPPRGESHTPRPAPSAGKAKWAEFATSQGMAKDEADALTRDELAAMFAEPEQKKTDDDEAAASGDQED